MSSATDPYQPVGLRAEVTRDVLEALAEVHPKVKLVIQARSPFVTRDLDLLEEIVQAGGRVQVNMTVTTTHEDTRKAFERGCPSAQKRLDAVKQVAQSGIGTCITMSPSLDLGLSEERDLQTLTALQDAFAHGVRRFIFQPVHVQNQNGQEFGAATRMQALDTARELHDLPKEATQRQTTIAYRGSYIDGLRRIKPKLEEMGAWVGTNRDCFKPPFSLKTPRNCQCSAPARPPKLWRRCATSCPARRTYPGYSAASASTPPTSAPLTTTLPSPQSAA